MCVYAVAFGALISAGETRGKIACPSVTAVQRLLTPPPYVSPQRNADKTFDW